MTGGGEIIERAEGMKDFFSDISSALEPVFARDGPKNYKINKITIKYIN